MKRFSLEIKNLELFKEIKHFDTYYIFENIFYAQIETTHSITNFEKLKKISLSENYDYLLFSFNS